jgi:hypothetical protein
VLSGCRRHEETKVEAGGWQDSRCAGHLSAHRVVHPAVLVQILAQLVSAPILVLILARSARVPAVLVRIPRAWRGKRQAGVPKGVPSVEQSLQVDQTRGRLISACRSAGHSTDQPVEWGEAFLRSETEAWRRTEPRAQSALPLASLAAQRSAFPVALRCAPGHRSFVVHEPCPPHLARMLAAGNCGAKDRRNVRVFPPSVVSSTPC